MDRNDCYKYTNKMIRTAGRDKTMIRTSSANDIEAMRIENLGLKKEMMEFKRQMAEVLKASEEDRNAPGALEDFQVIRKENSDLKKEIQELKQMIAGISKAAANAPQKAGNTSQKAASGNKATNQQ